MLSVTLWSNLKSYNWIRWLQPHCHSNFTGSAYFITRDHFHFPKYFWEIPGKSHMNSQMVLSWPMNDEPCEGERRMRVGATPAVTRCPWASLPRVLLLAVSQLLILRCSRPLRMSHRTSLTAYNPFRINPLRVSYRPLLEPTFLKFEGKNQRRLPPRCRAPTWILWSRTEHLPSVLRPSSQEHIPPASCWRIKGRNKSESKKSPNLE